MGSKLLLQPMITIPRNPNQCPPLKLGFSTLISLRPSSFSSGTRLSVSRVSSSSCAFNYKSAKRGFVVRAEADSEGQSEDSENVEVKEADGVEEEAPEAVSDTEVKAEEARPPRKPRVKLGDIMGILNKRSIEASEEQRPVPDLRTGDIVEIKLEVPENRRRLSIYKGIVISKQNAGIHTTIRIRRIIAGIGVEIVFPVYSPNIKEIKVVKHRKVRRARLYYLRDKLPRLSTFK